MMIKNLKNLKLNDFSRILKVGDSVNDIREGKSVGCWTVGIIEGGSLLGLS